ncbi:MULTISPECIES: tetratricopeptide repeat protein [Pirellulaceae]|nr:MULTISPECIES: tetratricopeptide repeat protein [Pirellulaceae]RCS55036.1 tetratricopeptide repeat protein [Bremerella cremea]
MKVCCSPSTIMVLAVAVWLTACSFASAEVPLFSGLGEHRWGISSNNPQAQAYFNQGLAFMYGFNHDEAIRSFHEAARLDPNCPAPWWAISLANGPNINYPLLDEKHAPLAWEALQKAKQLASNGSPLEQGLIAALEQRYTQTPPEDRKPLDQAYADAMRKLWEKYPDEPDVGALFAESLMDLWPWDLWQKAGVANPDTREVIQTLEAVLKKSPEHPLALHLYIHTLEASGEVAKAADEADRLRNLQPGLGHMVHMPSHIDVRLGAWRKAIAANEKAITADTAYKQQSPEQDFFRIYMAHNRHMLAFAAMMIGQEKVATDQINLMLEEMPESWVTANAPFVDGMHSMPYEMHIRFGRWDAILEEPEPAEHFPICRAMRHFARGVAYAAKKQSGQARQEQVTFRELKRAIPEEAFFAQNPASVVLDIADHMLEGEILYREGKTDEAVASLTKAVELEDSLRYTEPPDWIQPVRHALAATLMDAKRYPEAEAVLQSDLRIHPHNGWALYDLARSLQMQGKLDEAAKVQAEFEVAWKDADVKMSSACMCLPAE